MKENQVTESWTAARYIREDGTIIDFTGLYEVSDQGRVKSLNYHRSGKVKIMSHSTAIVKDGSIFYTVNLRKDNKRHPLPVHRLILSSFRPEGHPEGYSLGAVCNHKKERTSTSCINELWNLEWTTQKANVNTEHSKNLRSKTQTNHPAKSKQVRVTNLTTGEVAIYPSAREADRALGLPRNTVSYRIRNQKDYKKLNLHFAYV